MEALDRLVAAGVCSTPCLASLPSLSARIESIERRLAALEEANAKANPVV